MRTLFAQFCAIFCVTVFVLYHSDITTAGACRVQEDTREQNYLEKVKVCGWGPREKPSLCWVRSNGVTGLFTFLGCSSVLTFNWKGIGRKYRRK